MTSLGFRHQDKNMKHTSLFQPGCLRRIVIFLFVFSAWAVSAQQIILAPEPEVLIRGEQVVEELSAEQLSAQRTRLMLDSFRDYYYFKKQIQLDVEMLLRERYLLGLFKGVNEELQNREIIGSVLDLNMINSPVDYVEPQLGDTILSVADHYLATSEYVMAEHHHKLIYAEALKAKLVEEGNPLEIKRMFDYDLRLAYKAYKEENYPLAILLFNHILLLYPYENMDDILFYRAESEYGASYYVTAAASYNRLLGTHPDTPYRLDAIARLFYIYQELDKYTIVKDIWDRYGQTAVELEPIYIYDQRWEELTDSIAMEELPKEEINRLKDALSELEGSVNFTREQVAIASKFYYAAGLGLFLGDYFADASYALDRIPNFSPNEFKASYLRGQALVHLGRFEEAINPFKLISEGRFKPSDPEFVLANDAKVKLGYCFSQLEDFETSSSWFNSVDPNSDSYKDALIGLAWTEYRQYHFDKVDSLTSVLIEKYPDDQRYYEAISLGGFNREMLGRQPEALTQYQEMVETVNKLTDVRNYIAERKLITKRVREAKAYEQKVIERNDPDLFLEYMNLINELDRLYKRVKIAEITELNKRMHEFLMERDSLRILYEDLSTFRDTIILEQNQSLLGSYDRLEARLRKLAWTIQIGGFYEARKATATQQTAELEYHNEATDSLISMGEDELSKLHKALVELQSARESLQEDDELNSLITMDIAEADLVGARRSYEENIVSLSEGRMTEIAADIETWRDFAFRRYALADLDFDYLLEQMNLLDDLTKRMGTIARMIQYKEEIAAEQEAELPVEEEPGQEMPAEIENEE